METITSDINDSSKIEVYYQDEVKIDVDLSLLYIQSGQKEINSYVENVSKPEIKTYIEKYAKPIVSGVVDQIATPVVSEYIEETVKPKINEYTNKKLDTYNSNAMEKQALVDAGLSAAIAQAEIAITKANEASNSALAAKNSQSASASYANQASNSATLAVQIADSINPDQFVKNTDNQTIAGVKTFLDIIRRSFTFSSSGISVTEARDSNNKGSINYTAYYAGNGVYNRMQANNTTSGKNAYLDVVAKDDGSGVVQFGGTSSLNLSFNNQSVSTVNVPTPSSMDSGTKATNTSWVRSKLFGIDYANPTAKISEGGIWAANSTYTVPSQGYAIITSKGDNCQLKVNGTTVGRTSTDSGSGWTSSISNVFLPLNKGDVVSAYGGALSDCYFYFWAI